MKKRAPRPALDFGTREFQKRRQVIINPQTRLASVKHQSVLQYYNNAGHIDDKQYNAGYKLSKLWIMAGKESRVTFNYHCTPLGIGNADEVNMLRVDALRQYEQSIAAVAFACRDAVIHTCCLDLVAGRIRMPRLREGLNDLAKYYKI